MRRVAKYPLTYSCGNPITLAMPTGAEVMCVHDRHLLVLQEAYNSTAVEFRVFLTYSTGLLADLDILGQEYKYIDSTFDDGVADGYHVFELIKRKEG